MRACLFLCLLAASFVAGAEWQVAYPNVMTIAIGVSAPDDSTVYVSGAADGKRSIVFFFSSFGNVFLFH